MNVETFQIFCDLADTGSFTRTAKLNGVTQSAISQQIAFLERRLHGPLLNRDGFGSKSNISLTPEGQVFLQNGQAIIRLMGEMHAAIQKMKDTHVTSLELAVCHSIALHQLPSILQRFQTENPAVVVQVRHGNPDQIYGIVREGAADLGLVSFPRREVKLKTETFRKERLVLVCHPQHPLAAGPPVVFKKLKGERFIAWKEFPWFIFLRSVRVDESFLYRPVQEFEELEAVKQAVESDLGISILPEATVRSEVASQTLAAVPFKGDGYYEPLGFICRKFGGCSPAMGKFIQFLKRPDGMDGMDSNFGI
jgi:DNA-binding transcriptional LysR family regulator